MYKLRINRTTSHAERREVLIPWKWYGRSCHALWGVYCVFGEGLTANKCRMLCVQIIVFVFVRYLCVIHSENAQKYTRWYNKCINKNRWFMGICKTLQNAVNTMCIGSSPVTRILQKPWNYAVSGLFVLVKLRVGHCLVKRPLYFTSYPNMLKPTLLRTILQVAKRMFDMPLDNFLYHSWPRVVHFRLRQWNISQLQRSYLFRKIAPFSVYVNSYFQTFKSFSSLSE